MPSSTIQSSPPTPASASDAAWEAIWRADAARTLAFWCEYASDGLWEPAAHLLVLCEKLAAVERGEIRRLIIEMPPQHGKSWSVSRLFAAWYLGRNPDRDVILGTYGSDLAEDHSRWARAYFTEHAPGVFGVGMAKDSHAVNRWGIQDHTGGMRAVGVGGPITGRRAHLLIIDDPIKNDAEANSATHRAHIWEWYRSSARTRVRPGGAIVVMHTRWHEDDLIGTLLKQAGEGGEQWERLRLPAIAEVNDALGRSVGEPLWPASRDGTPLYDLAELAALKRSVGPYWWAALYQQAPQPAEGAVFKRQWNRYATLSDDNATYTLYGKEDDGTPTTEQVLVSKCRRYQMVDPAISVKTSADYFVIETWDVTPKKQMILVDVLRTRVEGPEQADLLVQQYQRHRPSTVWVETVAFQKGLMQSARRQALPIRELKAEKDKYSRALVGAARYASGDVFHPSGEHWWVDYQSWLPEYEAELAAFTANDTHAHDDQVDAAAYMAIKLSTGAADIREWTDWNNSNKPKPQE